MVDPASERCTYSVHEFHFNKTAWRVLIPVLDFYLASRTQAPVPCIAFSGPVWFQQYPDYHGSLRVISTFCGLLRSCLPQTIADRKDCKWSLWWLARCGWSQNMERSNDSVESVNHPDRFELPWFNLQNHHDVYWCCWVPRLKGPF